MIHFEIIDYDVVSVSCFGVRFSVMFHFMFVHYTFSSVWVAEWPPSNVRSKGPTPCTDPDVASPKTNFLYTTFFSKCGIRNSEFRIRNSEFGIQNSEFGIQNSELRSLMNRKILVTKSVEYTLQ